MKCNSKSIAQVAAACGFSELTLRFYEQEGDYTARAKGEVPPTYKANVLNRLFEEN